MEIKQRTPTLHGGRKPLIESEQVKVRQLIIDAGELSEKLN